MIDVVRGKARDTSGLRKSRRGVVDPRRRDRYRAKYTEIERPSFVSSAISILAGGSVRTGGVP